MYEQKLKSSSKEVSDKHSTHNSQHGILQCSVPLVAKESEAHRRHQGSDRVLR